MPQDELKDIDHTDRDKKRKPNAEIFDKNDR